MTNPYFFSNSTKLPSNQKFGWFFGVVFAAIAAYSYSKEWSTLVLLCMIVAALFAVTALFMPQTLAPLNRLWYELGILLGKIVSPIVLGIIFFVLITPVSLIARLFRRDELRLKKRNLESYWIDRSPPGPPSDSFKNEY